MRDNYANSEGPTIAIGLDQLRYRMENAHIGQRN